MIDTLYPMIYVILTVAMLTVTLYLFLDTAGLFTPVTVMTAMQVTNSAYRLGGRFVWASLEPSEDRFRLPQLLVSSDRAFVLLQFVLPWRKALNIWYVQINAVYYIEVK